MMPEKGSDWVDVLISKKTESFGRQSVVYEIPLSTVDNMVAICGHVYNSKLCTSLDYTYSQHHFVMSGNEVEEMVPYLFKYKNGVFDGNCFGLYCNLMNRNDKNSVVYEKRIRSGVRYVFAIPKETDKKEYMIQTDCVSVYRSNE